MSEWPEQGSVDGMLIRGGTSRGLYALPGELPPAGERRDRLLVELFGTPDPLQIDGIGGGNSHTSKVMLVDDTDRPGLDVEYTFGQVAVENATVDWTGNCGNLTSGVGVFAILAGLVDAAGSTAELRLYNTNTDTVVEQTVPLVDGAPAVQGDYAIDGVPGTGARIDSAFQDPWGAVTGDLLPSGNLVDEVTVQGATYEVSLVDVANLNVFVRARDLGLDGTELPAAMDDPDLLERIELLRGAACELLGLVDNRRDARDERAAIPQIALVSEPQSYETTTADAVDAADIDVTSRIVTTQSPHHSYAMTGAMCLAAATQLPGTIPSEVVRTGDLTDVIIGHPKGRITVGVETATGEDGPTVEAVRVGRTARLLFDGDVFYRRHVVEG
ncbi:2-methylaconitate cis-trans isomerase PrpF family protein [Halorarius litoreus]|uniref:2-methylaconitate cis-trans isomerase PrpF family protein n=1 Tax=Halorarius litoreus TaxID=2962676 RepID=UPI0020CEC1A4|nr:PrpF domain-containing protein [Halorarius litoreus]